MIRGNLLQVVLHHITPSLIRFFTTACSRVFHTLCKRLIYQKNKGAGLAYLKFPVTAGLHGRFSSSRLSRMFFLQEMMDGGRQLTVLKAEKSGISSITAAHCQEAPGTHMDSLISNRPITSTAKTSSGCLLCKMGTLVWFSERLWSP